MCPGTGAEGCAGKSLPVLYAIKIGAMAILRATRKEWWEGK